MSDRCLGGGKEMPLTMVAQPVEGLTRSLHLDCAGETIKVFQIEIEGVGKGAHYMSLDGCFAEITNHFYNGDDCDKESIIIHEKKMTRLQWHSLPDFEGY